VSDMTRVHEGDSLAGVVEARKQAFLIDACRHRARHRVGRDPTCEGPARGQLEQQQELDSSRIARTVAAGEQGDDVRMLQ
jgi:hypothetical protein